MNHPEMQHVENDIGELVTHLPPPLSLPTMQEGTTTAYKRKTNSDETGSNAGTEPFSDLESEKDGRSSPPPAMDIYSIAGDGERINPWSIGHVGVPIQYFSVGLMIGGSTSILYPILVVNEGVTSSLLTASTSIVTIFWSYKILFGFLSDCFPILGWKRKPYIALGWALCVLFLIILSSMGSDITSKHLVLMLTMANMGYVMADVAADGFMVYMAHREPINERGKTQTLVYATSKVGQIFINLVILLGFSGPQTNCPGFEEDTNVPCTTNPNIIARSEFVAEYPGTWCYMKCSNATLDWDISIPQFVWIIASINLISLPFYFLLKEDKAPREPLAKFMGDFWNQLKRKGAWQVILYSMISHITFGVINAAKTPANYVWLNLHTFQYQVMIIIEKLLFFIGLNVIRRWALHISWRKMIFSGSMLVTSFNLLYFIVVFDIWRNPWFYIFTDVSASFMYTLNFLAGVFCMVEVAEPGFEAITYSLITTASNTVSPLSSVISYQLLAFFPLLNTQESIATDTPEVRKQFATLQLLTILINLTSLIALPMLPRQKKETRELVAQGEVSAFWGRFALLSALTFLAYSSVVTFLTVAAHDVYGCFKILGGGGCSAEESAVPAYTLVVLVLLYCYGVNFYHSFWPIVRGQKKFQWSMFY